MSALQLGTVPQNPYCNTYEVGTTVRVPREGGKWEGRVIDVEQDAGRESKYTVQYEDELGGSVEHNVTHGEVIG